MAFYVNRDSSPVAQLATLLVNNPNPQKILFAGHRGSGKSTELYRLREALGDGFIVFSYTVEGSLDLAAVDYVQVLSSMLSTIYREGRKLNIKFPAELTQEMLNLFGQFAQETTTERKSQASIEGQLDLVVVKLGSRLLSESTTRETFRAEIEPRVSELVRLASDFTQAIASQTKKKLVVVIDGLDKPDLHLAKDLFVGHGAALAAPNTHIVYTIPLPLAYSNDFKDVRHQFNSSYVLPNIPVRGADGTPNKHGLGLLKAVVEKRMRPALVSAGALDHLAEYSGGVLRELVSLVQNSAITAITHGELKIDLGAARSATKELKDTFRRQLRQEHFLELVSIRQKGGRLLPGEMSLELLHNGSLLEYPGPDNFFGINPAVEDLLEEIGTLEA